MQAESILSEMKKNSNILKTALFLLALVSFVSCNKKEELAVPVDHLWFPGEACVQELNISANCSWSVTIDDGTDWFSVDPMSGSNNEVLKITVKAIGDAEQRSSSFTITSAKGQVQLQVRVSQNTEEPTDIESLTNLVFGVATVTHWNVDYFGEVLEETYRRYEFDPNDTTSGYIMYFLEDSIGIQRDNVSGDSTMYYTFKYDFNPVTRILHLDFVTIEDTTEIYDAPVLIATEELFRFQHEYKPMRWELADMRKIGTLRPQEKARILQAIKKRKPKGGVFQF